MNMMEQALVQAGLVAPEETITVRAARREARRERDIAISRLAKETMSPRTRRWFQHRVQRLNKQLNG